MRRPLLLFLLILIPALSKGSLVDTIPVRTGKGVLVAGEKVAIFEDSSNELQFKDIQSLNLFSPSQKQVPNLGLSNATIWLKFTLYNATPREKLLVALQNPLLNHVRIYYPDQDSNYIYQTSGDHYSIWLRKFKNQNIIFEIPVKPSTSKTIYLKVKSRGQILLPIYAGTVESIVENLTRNDLIFGLYMGVILVMFFYNLFVYFSVKDKSYLYYVLFILTVGLTQMCLQGYIYRFFIHDNHLLTDQSINWMGALSGIATALFVRNFLHTKKEMPFVDKMLTVFIFGYTVSIGLTLFRLYDFAYSVIDVVAFIGSIVAWLAGFYLVLKGFRPAKFFMVAWSFFLFSVILYVLKDIGVIPFNLITNNILLIGSSVEISLLSLALADKINLYKKEKEESQAEALQASIENERLVKEQNIILETKVNERTTALRQANTTLNTTLVDLKGAQSKLVETEKMASLGQLTAGIAHEINNPINFVKSNINPLKMDIADLIDIIKKYEELNKANIDIKLPEIHDFKGKINFDYLNEEIYLLLNGIEEGASRTAEIVKGLRTFSHVDENTLKEVDIHEGIDATLGLIRNHIPKDVEVIRHYGTLPNIECYPGNINQVFMNILMNSIQAIEARRELKEEKIIITTDHTGNEISISIQDSGIGIEEEVKEKIFDPFFTTKEVGEGTGLGLSIVFSIIEKHQGNIRVVSNAGRGSNFIITLPIVQKPAMKEQIS